MRGMPETAAKIPQIAAVAEGWLDLGETERAKSMLEDGLKSFDSLPYPPRSSSFLTQLLRVEPELALAHPQSSHGRALPIVR